MYSEAATLKNLVFYLEDWQFGQAYKIIRGISGFVFDHTIGRCFNPHQNLIGQVGWTPWGPRGLRKPKRSFISFWAQHKPLGAETLVKA